MSEPSSVLLVTPRWARDGGVGAHIQRSAAALAKAGIEVSVLVARVESDEAPEGVKLIVSPRLFREEAPLEERFGEALDGAPEVVHLNQLDSRAVVERLRRVAPVVTSAHGFMACTAREHYFGPGQECQRAHGPGCVAHLPRCAHATNPLRLPGQYREASRTLAALAAADLVVSYSTAVNRHLAVNGLRRRAVVPYFPTIEPRQGSGHEHRRRVVFAGRVTKPKGIDTFVRAAAQVEGEFVVCGDGRALPGARRLAERLGLNDEHIRFTGWLDPDGLAEQFAEASIVAIPSLWPEPFGLVGIEAFAAGRPAVASATGGIGDWLQDGLSGICVPAGDDRALAAALAELLADPERQRRMGEFGRQTVAERFSIETHLAALRSAYGAAREHWLGERQLAAA
jgi:glycosyltransferase involved in cell wall biosynthesis